MAFFTDLYAKVNIDQNVKKISTAFTAYQLFDS